MSFLEPRLIWLQQRLWVSYEYFMSRFLIPLKNGSRHRLNLGVGIHLPKQVHVATTKDIVNSNTASYTTIESYFLQ
jgi:hypothetical protein